MVLSFFDFLNFLRFFSNFAVIYLSYKRQTKEAKMVQSSASLVVAGVNFRKTTLEIRNKFALTTDHIKRIYDKGGDKDADDFFILSTCNRTEIYGINQHAEVLLNLLAANNHADAEEIKQYSFVK